MRMDDGRRNTQRRSTDDIVDWFAGDWSSAAACLVLDSGRKRQVMLKVTGLGGFTQLSNDDDDYYYGDERVQCIQLNIWQFSEHVDTGTSQASFYAYLYSPVKTTSLHLWSRNPMQKFQSGPYKY